MLKRREGTGGRPEEGGTGDRPEEGGTGGSGHRRQTGGGTPKAAAAPEREIDGREG